MQYSFYNVEKKLEKNRRTEMLYCECFIENNLQNITINELKRESPTYKLLVGGSFFRVFRLYI